MSLPNDLPARIRKAGLTVVTLDGWRGRRRPGTFAPRGVLWHHTGGGGDGLPYAQWMGLTGRPDLPAPLCQLSIGRDGTVYVLARGRANHAGTAKASGPMPAGDGNALYVGVECHNTGSEGWDAPQYDAMVKVAVVLSDALGCTAAHHRGHRETSVTGKWDPGLLDLVDFRNDIAEAMKPPRNPVPTRKAITQAIQRLKKGVTRAERQGYPAVAKALQNQIERLRKIRARKALNPEK